MNCTYTTETGYLEEGKAWENSTEPYTDYDFSPDDERIIDPTDEVDDLMDLGPVEWRRAADIPALVDADGKLHLFAGAIEPNDIKQGQIGDCYFLSSLAALAEKPERIRKMFLEKDANACGRYGARMFKNGINMVVRVDD